MKNSRKCMFALWAACINLVFINAVKKQYLNYIRIDCRNHYPVYLACTKEATTNRLLYIQEIFLA